jgi:endosialidase-like protein
MLKTIVFKSLFLLSIIGLISFNSTLSYAQCTSPASPVGGVSYGSAGDISTMMACDGTDWVPWAGWGITGYAAPQYSSGGASVLNDLIDTTTTTPVNSEVLTYNGSFWVNQAAAAGVDGEIQFNSNGTAMGASGYLIWDDVNGRLGIKDLTPDAELDIVGNINYTGQIVDVSDIRMKYNIEPLQNPLQKLTSLNGFSFNMRGDSKKVTEYGVSAQDVQKVFPELVSVVDRNNGTLGVNYNGLIAPMIEAIKMQQVQIKALQVEIKSLKIERQNGTEEQ